MMYSMASDHPASYQFGQKQEGIRDSDAIIWDVSKTPHAFVRLDSSRHMRKLLNPIAAKSGEHYSLTIIQDQIGGAGIDFDLGYYVGSNINTLPGYKTTVVFHADASNGPLILRSRLVSYTMDRGNDNDPIRLSK